MVESDTSEPRKLTKFPSFQDYLGKIPNGIMEFAKTEEQKACLKSICQFSTVYRKRLNTTLDKRRMGSERDLAYFKILTDLSPRLLIMKEIVHHCTDESIRKNKDNLVNYIIDFDKQVYTGGNNEPSQPYEPHVALRVYHEIIAKDNILTFPFTRTYCDGRVTNVSFDIPVRISDDQIINFIKADRECINNATWNNLVKPQIAGRKIRNPRRKTPNSSILKTAIVKYLFFCGFPNPSVKRISEILFAENGPIPMEKPNLDTHNKYDKIKSESLKQLKMDWFCEAKLEYDRHVASGKNTKFELSFDGETSRFHIKPTKK